MKELLELAGKLGEGIASSRKYVDLKAAEKIMDGDDEAKALFDSYVEQSNKIGGLELDGKPIEPEDKRNLRELMEKVHSNEKIQGLVKAQADFAELMNKVNTKVQETLRDASSGKS